MELLSKGSAFEWERKEIGKTHADWENFVVYKRIIAAEICLADRFCQHDLIIAPTIMTFPVVDFVFSPSSKVESDEVPPVVAFQCTWGASRGVNLKGLCLLRRRHMRIVDTQVLEIYIVCPHQEDVYTSMKKNEFLIGSVNGDLQLDTQTIVNSTDLQTMWDNTNLFVIRPKMNDSSSWEEQIGAYLSEASFTGR